MLIFSASVGVYFGYFNKSKKRTSQVQNHDESFDEKIKSDFGSKSMLEYLLGSRKLKSFPVAMSLVASYISGVTVLGTPAEIYNYGTQYWFIVVPIFFMGFVVSYVYLPVFCSLKVSSSYEVFIFILSSLPLSYITLILSHCSILNCASTLM
jgi:sodium-coupled monocarboxylate transporter 8/12